MPDELLGQELALDLFLHCFVCLPVVARLSTSLLQDLSTFLSCCCWVYLPSVLLVAEFLYFVVVARFVYLLVFLVLDLPTLLLHHLFYLVVVAGLSALVTWLIYLVAGYSELVR